jgi:hypothetical protein
VGAAVVGDSVKGVLETHAHKIRRSLPVWKQLLVTLSTHAKVFVVLLPRYPTLDGEKLTQSLQLLLGRTVPSARAPEKKAVLAIVLPKLLSRTTVASGVAVGANIAAYPPFALSFTAVAGVRVGVMTLIVGANENSVGSDASGEYVYASIANV